VPHDIPGMIKLMSGRKKFVARLDYIFEKGHYDMANEPDIAYPYLYNFSKGDEWKAQERIAELLDTYYKNAPNGLPGNDDTGTMSAWAVFSMMGLYPITPAAPVYTFSAPKFSKITIHLDQKYYARDQLIIKSDISEKKPYIDKILIRGKEKTGFFIQSDELLNAGIIEFELRKIP